MSLDESMLASAETGVTSSRVYTWDGVWVSLGRSQVAAEVVLGDIRWVQRPTGGSAVLHGHDVTVSIAMPLQRGVTETYRVVTKPLLDALHACGIDAVLAEDAGRESAYRLHADCFATTTRNDIVSPLTQSKICGCALRRTRSAVLLQASIPIAEPLVDPAAAIQGGVRTAITAIDLAKLSRELKSVLQRS